MAHMTEDLSVPDTTPSSSMPLGKYYVRALTCYGTRLFISSVCYTAV